MDTSEYQWCPYCHPENTRDYVIARISEPGVDYADSRVLLITLPGKKPPIALNCIHCREAVKITERSLYSLVIAHDEHSPLDHITVTCKLCGRQDKYYQKLIEVRCLNCEEPYRLHTSVLSTL